MTVHTYIAKEVEGYKLMAAPPQSGIHTSSIVIIPKPYKPGNFRLIVDLSALSGYSVNDGIPPDLCSIQYASVEDAANLVRRYGRGAAMAKLDLRNAYRMVPIHPLDQWLLGLNGNRTSTWTEHCRSACCQHPRCSAL